MEKKPMSNGTEMLVISVIIFFKSMMPLFAFTFNLVLLWTLSQTISEGIGATLWQILAPVMVASAMGISSVVARSRYLNNNESYLGKESTNPIYVFLVINKPEYSERERTNIAMVTIITALIQVFIFVLMVLATKNTMTLYSSMVMFLNWGVGIGCDLWVGSEFNVLEEKKFRETEINIMTKVGKSEKDKGKDKDKDPDKDKEKEDPDNPFTKAGSENSKGQRDQHQKGKQHNKNLNGSKIFGKTTVPKPEGRMN